MRQVIDQPGCTTSSGIGWPLACSAAAHFAVAAVLVLSGGAGGAGGRDATAVIVDLVPGGGGGSGFAVAPPAPVETPELPAPAAVATVPGPRHGDGRAEEFVARQAAPDPAATASREADPVVAAATPSPPAGTGASDAESRGAGEGDRSAAGEGGAAVAGHGRREPPGGRAAETGRGSVAVSMAPGVGGDGGWSGLLRERIQSRIVYPEEAVRRGLEGEVLLRIHIETGGTPGKIRVARSSGARILDDAARRGVVRAAPLPVSPGWVEIPVLFRLR